MENSDKIYLHNQLYTYKHPAISGKVNIIYKTLGILMAGVTLYLISNRLAEGSFNELIKEDWWLVLYLFASPFFFFMKEILERRQTYLVIDFKNKKIVHKAEGSNETAVSFNQMADIDFHAGKIILQLKSGDKKIIDTGNVLYKELKNIKTKFELIKGLIASPNS